MKYTDKITVKKRVFTLLLFGIAIINRAAAIEARQWRWRSEARSFPIQQGEQRAVLRIWVTGRLHKIFSFVSSNDFKTAWERRENHKQWGI